MPHFFVSVRQEGTQTAAETTVSVPGLDTTSVDIVGYLRARLAAVDICEDCGVLYDSSWLCGCQYAQL